ncbi:MAG TPA: DNA repair protein RecO [Vicinamibacterales bacterium]
MRVHSADALILRTYRYGEADRIVVFLTEDRGKRRGVAKNATTSRRRFGAALEPMTRGRVTYVERENRELVRLDRIELRESPWRSTAGRPPDEAAHALGHAAYFAELVDEWAPDHAANERLFRLGAAMSERLGQTGSVDAVARYFEYWLLRLEGVYPDLDRCAHCNRSLDAGAVLDDRERGFVCGPCAHASPSLSPDALRFLRSLTRRRPDDVAADSTPARVLQQVEQAHRQLIALHLEKQLRSARVVSEMRPRV